MSRRPDHADLWTRYRATRSLADRNALIVAYLPLVTAVAQKVRRSLPAQPLFDLSALINSGVPGLIDAIEKFDAARGTYFGAFAYMRIRGAIFDELRRTDWVPRLERARLKAGAISQTTAIVPLPILRDPDNGDEESYAGQIRDPQPGPDARLAREDFWRETLRGCSRQERLIVQLYFREELTMREIGAELGIGESRVSQLMTALLERWRARAGIAGGVRRVTGNGRRRPPQPARAAPRSRQRQAAPPTPAPAVVALPRSAAAKRTTKIVIRVAPEEKQLLQQRARALGQSVSTFVRETVLAFLKRSA